MPILSSILQRFPAFRSVSLIAAGNLAGQAITIGSAPLLARLYSPADFGLFATLVTVATLGAVIAPLGLHQAMHIPAAAGEAVALVRCSLKLIAAATTLFLVAAGGHIVLHDGSPLWLFVPVAAGAAAITDTLTYWATREGQFRLLVAARLIGAVSGVTAMLLLTRWHAAGLLAGHVAGSAASALGLLVGLRRVAAPPVGSSDVRVLLRRFAHFPRWRLPAGLLNAALAQAPLWMFSHAFGPAVAGHYSMAQRVFNAPNSFLGNAIAEVFQREAGHALRTRGECRGEFQRHGGLLVALALALGLLLAVFGPSLFAFVFGEPWRPAGELARWLAPLFALRFALSPLSGLLILGSRPGIDLALQLLLAGGSAVAWGLALHTRSIPTTVACLTGVAGVFYAANTFVAWRIARGRLPIPGARPV